MANKESKNAKNVAGSFYVDNECIGCGMCHEIAPDHFVVNDADGVAYVVAQPADDDAKAQCVEAMNSCPVEAIGDDGE